MSRRRRRKFTDISNNFDYSVLANGSILVGVRADALYINSYRQCRQFRLDTELIAPEDDIEPDFLKESVEAVDEEE